MFWAGILNLNQFVNSIVFNHNAINHAPVFCDISIRIILGGAVAIPAASLCINRRLYNIASVRTVAVTKAERRRGILVDLAIGLGLPVLEMILSYIPMGHRFNIFEDVGCSPYIYTTPVAIVLVSLPPVIIGCISGVYSILSICAFAKSHAQFKALLSNHSTSLTSSRYIRLMILAGIEAVLTVPLGLWSTYENTRDGQFFPWKGWDDTHADFSRVEQIPAILWQSSPISSVSLSMTRSFTILCALIFFAFFGFAEEARKNYRFAVQSVAKRTGVSTAFSGSLFSSTESKNSKEGTNNMSFGGRGTSLPVFVERNTIRKHDSLDSLSDMSASFNSSNILDDEKKAASLTSPNYNGLKISDVGGVLADSKDEPYSPTLSSSSSASSFSESRKATENHHPLPRPDSSAIEIYLLCDIQQPSPLLELQGSHRHNTYRILRLCKRFPTIQSLFSIWIVYLDDLNIPTVALAPRSISYPTHYCIIHVWIPCYIPLCSRP